MTSTPSHETGLTLPLEIKHCAGYLQIKVSYLLADNYNYSVGYTEFQN